MRILHTRGDRGHADLFAADGLGDLPQPRQCGDDRQRRGMGAARKGEAQRDGEPDHQRFCHDG
jgi:hypothetical protein